MKKEVKNENFREFLERLRAAGERVDIKQPVDIRHIATIAEHFGEYEFQAVARAMGRLHAEEKLWQDARGRLCLRGSVFAAKPPAKTDY